MKQILAFSLNRLFSNDKQRETRNDNLGFCALLPGSSQASRPGSGDHNTLRMEVEGSFSGFQQ